MRKPEKEITDIKEIAAVMEKAAVCRIAFVDEDYPYIIPVNFVVRGNRLYFHTGRQGKKIDLLRKNNRVCFEMETDTEVIKGDTPCSWSARYRSVIGFGKAFFLEEAEDKKLALDFLMEKYAGKQTFHYKTEALEKVVIIGIGIEKITGKKSGYK